jgi:precorrin-6B methylase 1
MIWALNFENIKTSKEFNLRGVPLIDTIIKSRDASIIISEKEKYVIKYLKSIEFENYEIYTLEKFGNMNEIYIHLKNDCDKELFL